MAKIFRDIIRVEADDFELCAPDVGGDFGKAFVFRENIHVIWRIVVDKTVPIGCCGSMSEIREK